MRLSILIILLFIVSCTSVEETIPSDSVSGKVTAVDVVEQKVTDSGVEIVENSKPSSRIETETESEPINSESQTNEVFNVAPRLKTSSNNLSNSKDESISISSNKNDLNEYILKKDNLNEDGLTDEVSDEFDDYIPPAPSPTKKVSNDDSKLVSELLKKADEKVVSYSFVYAPPPDNVGRNNFHIRGTKMRIDLFKENWVDPKTNMDTVYVDAKKKSAVGYCESHKILVCDNRSRSANLDYEYYKIKTPYQWVKDVKDASVLGSEMLWGRRTYKVNYNHEGADVWQWIDSFSGLPLRVSVREPNDFEYKFEFRDLSINDVSNNDVTPNPFVPLIS